MANRASSGTRGRSSGGGQRRGSRSPRRGGGALVQQTAQDVLFLRRKDRSRRLQAGGYAEEFPDRPRQDPAAAADGNVRQASASARCGDQACPLFGVVAFCGGAWAQSLARARWSAASSLHTATDRGGDRFAADGLYTEVQSQGSTGEQLCERAEWQTSLVSACQKV